MSEHDVYPKSYVATHGLFKTTHNKKYKRKIETTIEKYSKMNLKEGGAAKEELNTEKDRK